MNSTGVWTGPVRAYFVGTMGWFDGNPTSLGTLAPGDEAKRFIDLVGGPGTVLEAAEAARSTGDHQWALQLVDRLIFSDQETERAKRLKVALLREHADNQINCTARHYYLQCAKELDPAT